MEIPSPEQQSLTNEREIEKQKWRKWKKNQKQELGREKVEKKVKWLLDIHENWTKEKIQGSGRRNKEKKEDSRGIGREKIRKGKLTEKKLCSEKNWKKKEWKKKEKNT